MGLFGLTSPRNRGCAIADLIITAANVIAGTSPTIDRSKFAGETITAGMSVYVKAADGKVYMAKDTGTAEQATLFGVALHAALAGQPIDVQTGGPITIGATVVVGTIYQVSSTFGGIAPVADGASTQYVSLLGVAINTTQIQLTPIVSGITKA